MLDHLQTEGRNPSSTNLDELTALEIVRLMSAEDAKVVPVVATQAEAIARAIDAIADRLRRGGRLVYAGAGTSGRLGVLDATECPPTFNSPTGQVVGVIAGGPEALTRAVEGAEDHPEFADRDLAALRLGPSDVVVGIATSGRTPYVLGAAAYARRQGAYTVGISCNTDSELTPAVDLAIAPIVGPEIVSGSTRLKAGTATKLVLNMLTTGAMVRLGKTFGDLMVDLRATNNKLRIRCNRIVRQATGLSAEAADALLRRCGGEVKIALVVHRASVEPEEARRRLDASAGRVRSCLIPKASPPPPPTPAGTAAQALYLGIDGGGTHTVALLADAGGTVLGRGEAGPSNMNAAGVEAALRALETATAAAFAAARLPVRTVRTACLGLAGADRAWERSVLDDWARRVRLCEHLELTSDAALLLAAGTPDNWGLAVVAGTGSIAIGRAADGRTARAGGWGYLLGDEGSGYRITLAALQAVARAADGRGPATTLTDRFLAHLDLLRPQDLIGAVYRSGLDRAALAALAPVVLDAAGTGDHVAAALIEQGATDLASMALAAARQLGLDGEPVPLALAGGLLLGAADYRRRLLEALEGLGLRAAPVALVHEPAAGAVRRAQVC
ncbi:MAG: N-acetylmuramic acid 6-phosphate etherase [Gemmataceae bacterium]|nr:N-acetylmuramic acid 6-phosphate etherase [Gemmataceae bacterium]